MIYTILLAIIKRFDFDASNSFKFSNKFKKCEKTLKKILIYCTFTLLNNFYYNNHIFLYKYNNMKKNPQFSIC